MTRLQVKPRIVVCEAYEGLREAFQLMLEDWASISFIPSAADCFTTLVQQQVDMLILD